jgi:hypothetical protein
MGVNYGWEKFFILLDYAIASKASLQDRLASAISKVEGLSADSFPSDGDSWVRYKGLIEATTKLPALHKEGTIQATTSQMTDEEAARWLREAVGIFSDIARACEKG